MPPTISAADLRSIARCVKAEREAFAKYQQGDGADEWVREDWIAAMHALSIIIRVNLGDAISCVAQLEDAA